ncbi:MAG TPA: hypothetical protein VK142_06165 [Bacillota bacterium]|nr:hypothetical protein [Bacillota bacterium]
METANTKENKIEIEEEVSYKGAFFATTLFVGGGILLFIVLLFTLYMTRF